MSVVRKVHFVLSVLLTLLFTLPGQAEKTSKVVLHIYLHDGLTYEVKTQDIYPTMFAKLRPDLRYHQISVKAYRLGGHNEEVYYQIKEAIARALKPGETLAYLLIDTHGSASDKKEASVTSLSYFGDIYEDRLSHEFRDLFQPVQGRAEKDLKIIMNACDAFCGNKEKAVLRGQAFLNYFNASDGGIYGAVVGETDNAFLYPEFLKWKYLTPTWPMFIKFFRMAATFVFFASMAADISGIADAHSFWTVIENAILSTVSLGATAGTAASLSKLVLFFVPKTLNNHGYYFSFESGKLSAATVFYKFRDMRNLISGDFNTYRCANAF